MGNRRAGQAKSCCNIPPLGVLNFGIPKFPDS